MAKEQRVNVAGKRKTAVARATVKEGDGQIRVNKRPLEVFGDRLARMKIEEVLILASDHVDFDNLNIIVNVEGGGFMGQAGAVLNAIARGLVEWTGSEELRNVFLEYDRTILAGDHRQTEPHKPSQSSKGPRHKRQKSYR